MKAKRNLIQIWLLCAVMLPAAVQAQFIFTTNNDAITITGYTGSGGAVVIPSSTNGWPVTSIGYNAFYNESSVTSVTIPNSVINIGQAAFYGCTALRSVAIPDNVTSIGGGCCGGAAFGGCTSLTNVVIGNGLTSIASYVFDGCTSLKSVAIGTSVTNIGDFAFYYCTNLTSVTIPNSVTSIGGFTFQSCINLTNVTIGNHVISIGQAAFYGCTALRSVAIPDNVTSIGGGCCGGAAFGGCTSLTNVVIGNGLTSIASYVFDGCTSLKSVTIGTSVTSIGDDAFYYCTNLTSVYFKANAPSLGSYVFYGDNNATVFYLAGTTGWGTTFGGRPTARWLASLIVTPVTTTLYGSLLVGSNMNLSFTVYNAGSVTISGTATVVTPFSVVSGGSYTLAPGQSTNTKIRYAPTSAGNNAATVTFTGGSGAALKLTGSAYTDPTPSTGIIAGQVTRSDTHAALNGIGITAVGPGGDVFGGSIPGTVSCVIGGQAGRYSITGLPPNAHYQILATPGDQQFNLTNVYEVAVVAGQTTTVNITMTPVSSPPPAPTPENTPVVLVRGWGADQDWHDGENLYWAWMWSALVDQGFSEVWNCNEPEAGILDSFGGHVIDGTKHIEYNAGMLLLYIKAKALDYKHRRGNYPSQVNIIAHSMGGLITRRALQNMDHFNFQDQDGKPFQIKVGKVIMLGTPNAGTPLANAAVNVIGDLNWDSSKDLTTTNICGHYGANDGFNSTWVWPSKVSLYLFAGTDGKYSGDPRLLVGASFLGASGPSPGSPWNVNDGAVPVPSVSGIIYYGNTSIKTMQVSPVQNVTDYLITGRRIDHFSLVTDPATLDWVIATLKGTGTPAAAKSAKPRPAIPTPADAASTNLLPMQPIEQISSLLSSGQVNVASVISDAATTLSFQLLAQATDVVFRVQNPSGTIIDFTTPASDTNVQYSAIIGSSNLMLITYTINNPTKGTWHAVVDGSFMSETQASCLLRVFGDSTVALLPQTIQPCIRGQDVVLPCALADLSANPALPVVNASITAAIQLPDGSTNNLTLFDDGWHNDGAPNDGIYAAVLTNVQQAGTYSIAYRATGTNGQGQALQRVASGGFSVSSGHGNLLGDPVYENLDTDGDGIADFLEVKCWVNPATNGNYILAGDLVDASGTNRFSKSAAFAADGSGATMVTLIFDLAEIRAAGGSGDFHIENLQLFEDTGTGTAWLDAYQGSSLVYIQAPTKVINIGVWTNQFGFTITGSSNLVIVVEASTNLASPIWFPVGTNTLTGGSSYFSDPQWTNSPGRFYRLRSP
jgi:pimeloyl-ACP methyl ester carboxylesterase